MASNIEEPAYELVRAYSDFEVRDYATNVQARVQTAGNAPSGGFRRVAGYIFGGNQTGESIAMTAPVSMWEEKGAGWLAFTMPSAYDLEALPTPHDAGVLLVAQPKQRVAVMSFSANNAPKNGARRGKVTSSHRSGGVAWFRTGRAGRLRKPVDNVAVHASKRDSNQP